jgi:hypothetical protein
MPPTPPPVIINMPASAPGAPWWAPYLLAGLFVVVGATIGLLSTRLSDKRKQASDDLRQWDKEIRTLYLEAMDHYKKLQEGRWEYTPSKLSGRYYDEAKARANALETIAQSLEVIANPATVTTAHAMADAAIAIKEVLSSGSQDKSLYVPMDKAQKAFLVAVKVNLRIESIPTPTWLDALRKNGERRRALRELLANRSKRHRLEDIAQLEAERETQLQSVE